MPNYVFLYFSEPDTDKIEVVEIETLTGTEESSTKNDEKSTTRQPNGK